MPEDDPRPAVACLRLVFLPPPEAVAVEQLRALRHYVPVVLAAHAPSAAAMPPGAVCTLEALNPLAWVLNRAALALGGSCPHFERRMREAGCRLIHLRSASEARYGLALKARTQLPLVTAFDGPDVGSRLRHRPRVYERLFAAGDLFLASCQAVRKQLLALGCPDALVRVHYPGLDLERIAYAGRESAAGGLVNILMVGQMVERKGIAYALQAFAAVHRYQRRVALTLIGDGPVRPAVEALLREMNLRGAVRLLGAQPREVVLAEMARAHLYLQPSVTSADGDAEGIPMALVEAMASGLPVVATWHGGIPEIVADGRSGYLVSERNAHALAERLRHLAEHPELWAAFGRAGREIVESRFGLEQQAAELEAWYDELTEGA